METSRIPASKIQHRLNIQHSNLPNQASKARLIQKNMATEVEVHNPSLDPSPQPQSISSRDRQPDIEDPDTAPPLHAVNIAPRWNESKTMIWRVTATCLSAFVMGANDAAYGAIIPYVRIPQLEPISKT